MTTDSDLIVPPFGADVDVTALPELLDRAEALDADVSAIRRDIAEARKLDAQLAERAYAVDAFVAQHRDPSAEHARISEAFQRGELTCEQVAEQVAQLAAASSPETLKFLRESVQHAHMRHYEHQAAQRIRSGGLFLGALHPVHGATVSEIGAALADLPPGPAAAAALTPAQRKALAPLVNKLDKIHALADDARTAGVIAAKIRPPADYRWLRPADVDYRWLCGGGLEHMVEHYVWNWHAGPALLSEADIERLDATTDVPAPRTAVGFWGD